MMNLAAQAWQQWKEWMLLVCRCERGSCWRYLAVEVWPVDPHEPVHGPQR